MPALSLCFRAPSGPLPRSLFSRLGLVVRLLLFVALTYSCSQFATANLFDQKAKNTESNWPSYGRDAFEQRHSPLKQIGADNVSELKLDWYFDTGNTQGLQATPLVIDGVMYVSAAWSVVHALDAKTGKELWRYNPEVPRNTSYRYCCGVVNRGVAQWQGKIFVGTLDGRLIAIDQYSGQEIWSTQTTPTDLPYSITGAPRIAKGNVIIGNGGAEYGVRGFVSAYDGNTGEMAWRFYTVPGNPADGFENEQMAAAAKTWTGSWWEHGGGGTVWDSMVYDAELDLLYIGVGNGAPHNRHIRSPFGGDNLFLCSIIALRPDTGEYVWHYQEVPAETWDYTATQTMILADILWEGNTRKVLMQAPKAGFFYILDRQTGELLSAEKYVPKVSWASHYDMETGRPVEVEGQDYADGPAMVYPIGLGAHNWHPMSYSPDTGLVYIPAQIGGGTLKQDYNFKREPRHWNLGIDTDVDLHNAQLSQVLMKEFMSGQLLAWDPIKQEKAWSVDYPLLGNGGTLSTAGNLVFQGTVEGEFSAFHAKTGEHLWQFETQNGVIAAPISYAVDEQQYIAIPVGRGGGISQMIGIQHEVTNVNGRILAFSLSGKATLPEIPTFNTKPPPPLPNVDDATLKLGSSLYSKYCARCHGINAVSDGAVPDLRHLDTVWHKNFNKVVLEGMMESAGMPRFDDVLDENTAAAVHAFILEQANQDYQLRYERNWWTEIKQTAYGVMAKILAVLAE